MGRPPLTGGSDVLSRKCKSLHDGGTMPSTITNGGAAKRRCRQSEKKTVKNNAGTKKSLGLSKRAAGHKRRISKLRSYRIGSLKEWERRNIRRGGAICR
jgi:hypothetical protein